MTAQEQVRHLSQLFLFVLPYDSSQLSLSCAVDMEEFKTAMAVIIAVNKAEQNDDSDDEVHLDQTEDEVSS